MKFDSYRYGQGIFAALFASVLAGCAATDSEEDGISAEVAGDSAGEDLGTAEQAVTIDPPAVPFYVPPHVGGDKEYAGYGPIVRVTVDVMIVNGNEVRAAVYIDAKETAGDLTHASGTAYFFVHHSSRPIVSINSPKHFEFVYEDTDTEMDSFSFPRQSSLVNTLTCVGDTMGHEAGTRTGCSVLLHPITLVI